MMLDAGQGHMMPGWAMGWWPLLFFILLIILIVILASGVSNRSPREDLLVEEIRRLRREIEELKQSRDNK